MNRRRPRSSNQNMQKVKKWTCMELLTDVYTNTYNVVNPDDLHGLADYLWIAAVMDTQLYCGGITNLASTDFWYRKRRPWGLVENEVNNV